MPRPVSPWMTPLAASKRLGCSIPHVFALADRGRLRTRRDARMQERFARVDVEALAALKRAFPAREA